MTRVRRVSLAFEEAYEANVLRVYGFLAYRLRSREDAEDLTQLTFERALRAWGRYDPRRSQPGTWLLAIARNLIIDRYRSSGGAPAQTPLDEVHEDLVPASENEIRHGLDPRLAAAIGRLDTRAQEILALRFGGDLTGPEIV